MQRWSQTDKLNVCFPSLVFVSVHLFLLTLLLCLCGAISQENCKARHISMQKKKNRDIHEYEGVSCFITTYYLVL